MPDFEVIAQHIAKATGENFSLQTAQALSGGDINSAYCLNSQTQRYFVKLNHRSLIDMFQAESSALAELAQSNTLRVPRPICCGQTDTHAFLVLEYLVLQPKNQRTDQLLGEQLAALHQIPQAYFGWHRDNTIGSTPQKNTPATDWLVFWQQNRLQMQLNLAAEQGYSGKLQQDGTKLCQAVPKFFQGHALQASLLHGDLWGGNTAGDAQGQPVIFDPASYYGDREADIAMTELFGGFSAPFYTAYHSCFPLDAGYATRKQLYNLYHILNHLNLFGGSYLSQAQRLIAKLLAELRP